MTDWAFEEPGWWVDNVMINDELIDNADDVINFGFPPNPETDFIVTVIRVDYWQGNPYYSLIEDMDLDIVTEIGSEELYPYTMWGSFPYNNKKPDLLMIITPRLGPADYEFSEIKGNKIKPVR